MIRRKELNVLLTTLGTSGDVYPMLALGKALQQRGHNVSVVTIGPFEEAVHEAGLGYIEILESMNFEALAENSHIWNLRNGAYFIIRNFFMPAVSEVFRAIERCAGPGTVVVSTTLAFGARVAQEKLGIPLATVHLSPFFFMSTADPLAASTLNLPEWIPNPLAKTVYKGLLGLFEKFCLKDINRFRIRLGLPHSGRLLTRWIHSPHLVLGLFPDWFGAPASDWPSTTRLTGFVQYDRSEIVGLPENVRKFLEAGDPPVVFTPGTAMFHARDFFEAAIDSCRRMGRRGILLTISTDHIPFPLPRDVVHFAYVPFSLLLPHAAAFVHHGGIGSAAQGLRAGIPQLIMPLNYDQPENAARLAELGVAACLRRSKFTGPAVASTINSLLESKEVAERCRYLAEMVDFDPSLDRACQAIEELS